MSRRMFLELSVAGAVAAGAARLGVAQETQANGIPYRTLGRTGEKVSLVGIGGAHLGRLHDEQEAIRKSPDIHLHMLETAAAHQFTFDTVQMPLNVMDAHFNSFADRVLPVALGHHMGVLGMKSMGDHHILDSKAVTPFDCLHYAMNLPVSVVITGCDSLAILRQAIDAAKEFRPLSDAQLTALKAKTARVAANGKYELYKTSDHFDSTAHNPEWLG